MKNIIKYILLYFSSIIHHNKKSKILFYHDIYSDKKYTDMGTAVETFIQHIKVIQDNGFTITNKILKDENEVMICFDDGFKGIYDNRNVFIKNNFRPTVFIAMSLIGKPGYLDKKEILELQDLGFNFQCHAWSHVDLTSFSKDGLYKELYESRIELEKILNKSVDEICFPIGYFSKLVLNECKRYGYKTMYSSIPGNYFDEIYTDGLKTRNLVQFSSSKEVKAVLLGGNEIIRNHYIKLHLKG